MEEELDLRELIRPLRRWRWLILGLILAAGIAAFLGSKLSTPIYETKAKLLVVPGQSTEKVFLVDRESAGLGLMDQLGGISPLQMTHYVEILKSRTLLLALAEEMKLPTSHAGLKKLERSLVIQSMQGTGTIEIQVQDEEPRRAQRIADSLIRLFLARIIKENQENARQAREFIEEQMEVVGARLNRLGIELAKTSNKQDLPRLRQERVSTESLYTLLLTKRSEMEIAEHMRLTDVRLIDPPYLPPKDDPVKPRTLLNVAMGLFAGFFAGVVLAYLLEYRAHRAGTGNETGAAAGCSPSA